MAVCSESEAMRSPGGAQGSRWGMYELGIYCVVMVEGG